MPKYSQIQRLEKNVSFTLLGLERKDPASKEALSFKVIVKSSLRLNWLQAEPHAKEKAFSEGRMEKKECS